MLASIVKINGYNPFKALMLREYWENRRAIFTTPLVITAIGVVLIILAMGVFGKSIQIDGEFFTIRELLADISDKDAQSLSDHINHLLLVANMPIMIGVWFCMVFTALGSLYDERKDNSILFWKSMPVSDFQTILAKLLTVMFIIPLVGLGFGFIFQIFLLIVGSFATIGTDYNAWDLLWASTNLPGVILTEIALIVMYSLWALPVFAWFMLASVLAKRTPLLLATIPLALTALLENLFFGSNHLIMFVAKRLSINNGGDSKFEVSFEQINSKTSLDILNSFGNPELWLGLGIAAGLLFLTIWLRKRNSL